MSDLMEDSHDFGWQAAKGCHAVLFVKMEEGKVTWGTPRKLIGSEGHMPKKFSLVMSLVQAIRKMSKTKLHFHVVLYQRGTCSQMQDHENGGQTYLHVCALCFKNGKSYTHYSKDCKKSKTRIRHCSTAVPKSHVKQN